MSRRLGRFLPGRRRVAVGVFFTVSCLSLLLAATVIVLTAFLEEGQTISVNSRKDVLSTSDNVDFQHDGDLSPTFYENCTPSSVTNFPRNVMSLDTLRHGGCLINLAAVCYMFGILALVCDNYFMASLEIICSDLRLSEDVAGASFMAIGGSAPELFTSIFGVFIAKGNIGVGTVIGSAVFNILCVIGLCGLMAGQVVYLTKWPLARDFMWYSVTVICLAIVIFDNVIHWWEAMILLLLYVSYLIFLYFDPVIKDRLGSYSMCYIDHETSDDVEVSTANGPSEGENTPIVVDQKLKTSFGADDNDNRPKTPEDEKSEDLEANPLSPFNAPSGRWQIILWVLGFPASLLFYLTIPNCSIGRWRRWYPVTFVIALAWIGGITYLLVWMVTILGYVFKLPDTVMGLTLLAAGSSTPDTILSIVAARNGYGDMAICHSVGSNIFDILLGLGIPWFLHSTVVYHGKAIPTYSDGLTIIVGMLLGTVIITLVLIKLNSFKLNKKVGAILIACYILFLVPAILLETNVLIKGLVLPTCPV